jgi:hypothetical protein
MREKNMNRKIWPVVPYCGWFLMVPPYDKIKVLDHLPISKWHHSRSFDTANDCEINIGNRWAKLDKEKPKSLQTEALLAARCVPADSAR